jgi:hypothetical protein
MVKRMQFCFYCGEELGVYNSWPGDIESCGAKDCERELKYQLQAEREERMYEAERDDFNRY